MPVQFLIADDMPAQQKLLANVVLFLGGESRFASNGREVLRLAQEEMFDIVLLDLSMPELGGVAAANSLMESWASHTLRPRIVAVTGEKDEGTRMLCRAVGMDGFIAKPFAVSSVRKALKQLLVQGHCWPEGAARRLVDVSVLEDGAEHRAANFDLEVLESRTFLDELVQNLDELTAEQCLGRALHLHEFAKRHGLLALGPLMEGFIRAAQDGEALLFAPQLLEQRAHFEDAVVAIRAWRHHAPQPMRMSA